MPDKLYDDAYLLQLQSLLAATVKRSLEVLSATHGEQIADIGCGTGILAKTIAESGATVYGIDRDSNFLAIAKQNDNAANPVQFINAEAHNTGLPTAFLDKIVFHRVLQHINNHESVLQECDRLLKPYGRLHIVEPDYLSWSFFMDNVAFERKLIDAVAYKRIPNAYKVRKLPALIKQLGFEITINEVHNYIIDSFELANYLINFDKSVEEGFTNKTFTEEEYNYWQEIKSLPKGQFNLSVNLIMIDAKKG